MSLFDSIFGLSPVEKTVEAATSELLIASDWAKNAEIWEAISRAAKQDGGKEYLKAIRSRIQHKNPKVVMLALILLEATVKNCGLPYHAMLSKPDYLQPIVKVALKKDQKTDVRDKALAMIMSWAEAFARVKELQGFVTTYQELRKKGVDFPARDTTSLAPVVTPPPKPRAPEPARSVAPNPNAHPYSYVSEAFVAKTRADLGLVVNAIQLARDMLLACESGAAAKANGTLSVVLRNVKEMDARLSRLIAEIDHELLVGLCIRLSEEVRVVMDWYTYRLSDTPYTAKAFVVPPALVPAAAVPADGHAAAPGGAKPAAAAEINLLDRKTDSKSSPARLPAPGAAAGAPALVLAAAVAAADSKARAQPQPQLQPQPQPQPARDILNLSGGAGPSGGGGGNSKDPEADAFDALASRDVPAAPVVGGGSLPASDAAFAMLSQRTIEQSAARFPAPVIRPAGASPATAELSFTAVAPASASSSAGAIAFVPAAQPSAAAISAQPAITFEPVAVAAAAAPMAAAPSAQPGAGGGEGFDEFAALASRPVAGGEGEAAIAIAPIAVAAAAPVAVAVPMAVAPAPAGPPRITSDHVNAGVSAKEFEQLLDLTDVPSGPGAAAALAGAGPAPAAGAAADNVDLDELLRLASAQKSQHAAQHS